MKQKIVFSIIVATLGLSTYAAPIAASQSPVASPQFVKKKMISTIFAREAYPWLEKRTNTIIKCNPLGNGKRGVGIEEISLVSGDENLPNGGIGGRTEGTITTLAIREADPLLKRRTNMGFNCGPYGNGKRGVSFKRNAIASDVESLPKGSVGGAMGGIPGPGRQWENSDADRSEDLVK